MHPTALRTSLRSLADKIRDDASDRLESLRAFINEASWELATAAREAAPGELTPDAVRDLQESLADVLTDALHKPLTELEREAEEAEQEAADSYGDWRFEQIRDFPGPCWPSSAMEG